MIIAQWGKIRRSVQFRDVTLFAQKTIVKNFRTERPRWGLWSEEAISKNVDFSLLGNRVNTRRRHTSFIA